MDNLAQEEAVASVWFRSIWRNKPSLLMFALACGVLWWLTGYLVQLRVEEILSEHKRDLVESSDQIAVGLRRGLEMLHGIPAAVAQNQKLHAGLSRFLSPHPSRNSAEENRRVWSQDPELLALDRWLAKFTEKLGLMSVVWVMNKAGDALIASNYQDKESFVGTNYSDREYFVEAMAGQLGIQYAMGRRTNIPGFFFSSPVLDESDNVIGVVAGKIDLSFFAAWIGHTDALISDQYGVVILARDKELEMRTLPGATLSNLTEKERVERYKRNDFKEIIIQSWTHDHFSELYRIDNRPVPFLYNTVVLADGEAFLTVLIPVDALAKSGREHLLAFVLSLGIGMAALLLMAHIFQRQHNKRMLERTQELSQMVEELGRSQGLLRTVVDTVPLRVFWKDRACRYMGCNPSFARDAGKSSPDELLGLDDTHMGWADQAELYRADDRKVMESGVGKLGFEEPQSTPSGELIWLRTSKVPLRNNRGEVFGVLGVYEDITEFKQNEQRLNLAMEKLQHAMQQTETASRFKSEFLANMSHEIRTPMNAIIGLADLALHMPMPPKLHDYLTKIANASNSLLRIINDILDFSKVEAGKIALESADFELGRVCENLADLFRDEADKKNLELVMGMDPACPTLLRGDSLRLEQVLMNLIGNALKFTERGTVRLWVSVERTPLAATSAPGLNVNDDTVVLVFTVQDSGIGLSQTQREGLFTPFSQADSSTTRQYGGTGLGLSICKRLVELMGGRIWVESEPGSGSLFGFTAVFAKCPQSEQSCMVAPLSLAGLPVLVVEDNPIVREMFAVTLRSFTLQPVAVASGAEAVVEVARAVAAGTPYPLVLLDYRMPGINGIETAQQITDYSARLEVELSVPKMILLTAVAQEEDLELQANLAGIGAFLNKPVTRSRLFDSIMGVLGEEFAREPRLQGDGIDHQAVFELIGGAHILLVEDNPINQQVAREMLEQVGMRVTVANNGLEATRKVLDASFDLVFMDVQMPVMDGYAATRQIRGDARLAKLPIIAMTAHALEGDRQKSLSLGMNGHVTKPVDRKQLYAALLQWIAPGARSTLDSVPLLLEAVEDADNWEIPKVLPGIDVAAGLERLGGNHRLFRSLLLESGRDFASVADRIRKALTGRRQDDLQSARSLVHTLKGVAGNISAVELHRVAAALDQAIRNDQKEIWPTLVEQMDQVLTTLIKSINTVEQYKNEAIINPVAVAVDPVRTQALMNQLKIFLEGNNGKAVECFAELKPYLHRNDIVAVVTELESAIDRFDFAAARAAFLLLDERLGDELAGG
ncbi:MAG: response regulator [Magnetococcus sp. YQC-3]